MNKELWYIVVSGILLSQSAVRMQASAVPLVMCICDHKMGVAYVR